MSPALQSLFLSKIVPIITAAAPRVARPAAGEDAQDLVQDCLAMAAEGADSLERRRQSVVPKSVAYYAIARLKAGRRSSGAHSRDVYSPAAKGIVQLDSLDAPLTEDSELTLHDVISRDRDDPSRQAGRHLDWQLLGAQLNEPETRVIRGVAVGHAGKRLAAELQVSPARITQLKQQVADKARRLWGFDILVDAAARPLWRRAS
jgi:hypothetical protein